MTLAPTPQDHGATGFCTNHGQPGRAAIADAPGLEEVLRAHEPFAFDEATGDWTCRKCRVVVCVIAGRLGDAHAAHLADVVRAWLWGE